MDASAAATPRVDELVAELQARVETRRREGAYPPGLEQELDSHFRRIATHRVIPDTDDLRARLHALDASARFTATMPVDSGLPGGSTLHRAMNRLLVRQTHGILAQVQRFADDVRHALRDIVAALEDPSGHVHGDLVGQIDVVFDKLASYERGPGDSGAAVGNLRQRVEQLEAAEDRRRFRPWFGNARFEEQFRGTRRELRERYRDLAERLALSAPVLDFGCGRGEFLELLEEMGVEASGVEIDPDLVQATVREGLNVTLEDGIQHLSGVLDHSLGGLTLIQVVEHLSAQQVVELVSLAAEKLRPGGKVVVETVNPQSLYVFAHAFYADPTHTTPVHPAYLTFLFREAGFAEIDIDWRSPPIDGETLDEVAGDGAMGEVVNENVRRLNNLLFGPQDYALIATR